MRNLYLLLSLTTVINAYSIPELKLEQAKIGVAIDLQAYQGDSSNVSGYSYTSVAFQDLLQYEFRIPESRDLFLTAIKSINNPHALTIASTYINKLGSNADRFLISRPDCIPALTEYCDEAFQLSTKNLFSKNDSAVLVSAISINDRLYIFYKFKKEKPLPRDYFFISFSKLNGIYLMDCAGVSEPVIINYFNALSSGHMEKIKIVR